ncbi:hypothetical protein [Neorhizobium sp. JUb45]|uniref:hypothetical protein n=1 Tax=Neorhizobium sp. JUb45 TaxID=2485113 RepID=UPI0010515F27|nr:hypothetical protein [Neorhizobium sp. JUb45]
MLKNALPYVFEKPENGFAVMKFFVATELGKGSRDLLGDKHSPKLVMRNLTIIASAIIFTCSVPAKADRLVCSESEHARYMTVVGEVGEMGIDLNPVGQDRATFERLTAAYEKIDPKGPETALFVAHVPTGQFYSQACADERCTMMEMSAPEQACLIEHMNQCSYVALRFRGEEFCLLRSPKD